MSSASLVEVCSHLHVELALAQNDGQAGSWTETVWEPASMAILQATRKHAKTLLVTNSRLQTRILVLAQASLVSFRGPCGDIDLEGEAFTEGVVILGSCSAFTLLGLPRFRGCRTGDWDGDLGGRESTFTSGVAPALFSWSCDNCSNSLVSSCFTGDGVLLFAGDIDPALPVFLARRPTNRQIIGRSRDFGAPGVTLKSSCDTISSVLDIDKVEISLL